MTVEEFYRDDEDEGIGYRVNGDGTVDVDKDQMTMDEVSAGQKEGEQQEPSADNVTDLGQARKRRGRQSKAEQEAANDTPPVEQEKPTEEGASDPAAENYDDLPY
jgi:hypothetical protein